MTDGGTYGQIMLPQMDEAGLGRLAQDHPARECSCP